VFTLAAPLLTIPVTLRYLGTDLFGFWMIMLSITAMGMFADFGLGNGLLTRLSQSVATNDTVNARRLISTAYVTLGGVALALLGLIALIVPALDWPQIVKTDNGLDPAAAQMVAGLCLTAFAVAIPLALVQRVQYAYQQAWRSNLWQVLGAATTVGSVYAAVFLQLSPTLVIAASAFSGPFVILLNNVTYYGVGRRDLRPGLRTVSAGTARSLLRVGFSFFFLSLLTSFSLNADNIIVATVADLQTVSEYAVTAKLFALLTLAITLVALPLWPANGEALARGDWRWVKKATRVTMLSSVAAVAVGGLVLVLARDALARLWLGNGHAISLGLAVSLTVWSVVVAFASPYFSVQNSVGLLRYQYVGWTLFFLASIPLKFLFYPVLGLPGIPTAGVVAYLTILVPTAVLGYRATMREVMLRAGA